MSIPATTSLLVVVASGTDSRKLLGKTPSLPFSLPLNHPSSSSATISTNYQEARSKDHHKQTCDNLLPSFTTVNGAITVL